MKALIKLAVIFCTSFTIVDAQEQSGDNPSAKNPEIVKLNEWRSLDPNVRSITDQEIQRFCDYLRNSPVVDISTDDGSKVGTYKAWTAQGLYGKASNERQKKMIVDVMLDMLKRIQAERDALGVDPMSKTESHLYVDPPTPKKEHKNDREAMIEGQQRDNDMMAKRNRLSKKISNLSIIYGNFHRALTQLKVPLDGIPFQLERSPAEKARTKEMLEKRAAQFHDANKSPNEHHRGELPPTGHQSQGIPHRRAHPPARHAGQRCHHTDPGQLAQGTQRDAGS